MDHLLEKQFDEKRMRVTGVACTCMSVIKDRSAGALRMFRSVDVLKPLNALVHDERRGS